MHEYIYLNPDPFSLDRTYQSDLRPQPCTYLCTSKDPENPGSSNTMSSSQDAVENLPESSLQITGPTFLSRCAMPDVQPNAKIVAVCGINDWNETGNKELPGEASPERFGWAFSDFYLFHHLLKDVASDQVWLTCVSPETAIEKYGEYTHGDYAKGAMSARRVVLDKDMLGDVQDVRTVPDHALLERFCSALRDACHEASQEDRPVLVLIFTHAENGKYTLLMGGDGDPQNGNRLNMESFKQAIGSKGLKRGLCLLTTACHGGGWAINPDLNITTVAATVAATVAGQPSWPETLSWPVSGTANRRLCHSGYARDIAKSLLRLTIEGFTPDEDEITEMPMYEDFISIVSEAIQKAELKHITSDNMSSDSINQPMFAARNDDWEMCYSKRTGFPLGMFQQRWLELKVAKPCPPPSPEDERWFGAGEHRFGPGERAYSYDQLLHMIKRDGMAYLNSHPGDDSIAKNISLHNGMLLIIEGNQRPHIKELGYLLKQINYRMNQIMGAATAYKNFLGVEYPDCHEVSVHNHPATGTSKWIAAYELVEQYPLFDSPSTGHDYSKGDLYMVACILAAGWTKDEARSKIEGLVKLTGKALFQTYI